MIPLPDPIGILHDAFGNDPLTFAASPWPPSLEISCSTITVYTADQMRAWGVARAAAAVAREREKIAAMFDANPNAEMFRQDIADAIRKGGGDVTNLLRMPPSTTYTPNQALQSAMDDDLQDVLLGEDTVK